MPYTPAYDRNAPDRFSAGTGAVLRAAGWQPGRWDIRIAEGWADGLRAYISPGGHLHQVFPAAVEVWAEFGGLRLPADRDGRELAPTPLHLDPLHGLHLARTLGDLGRALGTQLCPLGGELAPDGLTVHAVLAIDVEGRVYSLDHTGDWYLGHTIDEALETLLTGLLPTRLTP